MMSLYRTLSFIVNHPLNSEEKAKAVLDFFRWQIGSRIIRSSIVTNFVNNSRLLVEKGMTGATGNIYTGLHEFEDMSFLLHFLKNEDLFVDVGANIGSYTVLASGVVGANSIAIEPIPSTYERLLDNIYLNRLEKSVQSFNVGVGSEEGFLHFTSNFDTENHVVLDRNSSLNVINVPIKKLDSLLAELDCPRMIKIDVEGYETAVLQGAEKVFSDERLLAVVMELNGSGKKYDFDEFTLHMQMINDYGFKPYTYFPFERELIPLDNSQLDSGNTLYIREIKETSDRVHAAPFFSVRGRNV